jgi:pimeloyl-ACP methyl ester carboxylesterase
MPYAAVNGLHLYYEEHGEGPPARTSGLVQSFTGWTDDQLRGVPLPVLILVGDTDFIGVENAAEATRLLPQGQLAVLPGTTHMAMARSTLLAPVIEAFLA